MNEEDFDNTPERDPLWDAEVGVNRFISGFLGSHAAMTLDELDSLELLELIEGVEDYLSISIPLGALDAPRSIRAFKQTVMSIYQQEWNV